MKMDIKNKFWILGLGTLFLASCGGDADTENGTGEEGEMEEVVEACTYEYSSDETTLTWTAFKLTERVGVSGTFDQIDVEANNGSSDFYGTLTGATFSIPIGTLNSQDEVRDPKIKNSFFGVMNATEFITGSVKELSDNGGKVEILMNGMTASYDGEVSREGEEITFTTQINLLDFDAQPSIDSLGVVCEAKHTGPDGVNKLWSEVDLAIRTTLKKTCE